MLEIAVQPGRSNFPYRFSAVVGVLRRIFRYVLCFLALAGMGCDTPEVRQLRPENPADYDFSRPDTIMTMPPELTEISGIVADSSGRFYAVQDERGELFQLAPTGRIEARLSFGSPGDYEGIAIQGRSIYIMQSDGVLYQVNLDSAATPRTTRYDTSIKGKCDAEAFTFDDARDRFLLGCKEDPGKEVNNGRVFFEWPLAQKRYSTAPAFVVWTDTLKRMADPGHPGTVAEKARVLAQGDLDVEDFRPSAMGFHPITGELYVLSSGARFILVLTPEGKALKLWRIPPDRHPQPEGLTFLSDGTLLISDEGGEGRATITRYRYKPASSDG